MMSLKRISYIEKLLKRYIETVLIVMIIQLNFKLVSSGTLLKLIFFEVK